MKLSLLLVALAVATADALRVSSRGVSPLASPVDRERFVQEWSVTASDASDHEPLQSIVIDTACQVYVAYEPLGDDAEALATVRVLGDQSRLVEALVAVSSNEKVLNVRSGSPWPASVNTEGFARAEIVVHRQGSIRDIRVDGSGDVILADRVVSGGASSSTIVLSVSGSGDLFLTPNQTIKAVGLDITSSGSGDIKLPLDILNVQTFSTKVSGSGDISLDVASFTAATASILVPGSGSTTISFARVLSSPQFDIQASGSGDVIVKPNFSSARGRAANCRFESSGSGDVDASGISCISAVLQSSGSGDMTVQVRVSLVYRVSEYSDIFYVGGSPISVSSMDGRRGHSLQAKSTKAPSTPSWVISYTVPAREATHFLIGTGNQPGDDNDGHALEPTTPPVVVETPLPTPSNPAPSQMVSTLAPAITTPLPTPITASPQPEPTTVVPPKEIGAPVAETKDTDVQPVGKEVETSSGNDTEVQVDSHRALVVGLVVSVIGVVVVKRIFAWCGRRNRRRENAPLLSNNAPVYI